MKLGAWVIGASTTVALVVVALWALLGARPTTVLSVVAAPGVVPADLGSATPVGPHRRLLVPVSGVSASDLVDTYAQARADGRRHDAIDIAAPRGTPVLAVEDGTVLKLFISVRGGTTLYQLAPDGHTIYYYAHLERYADGIADGKSLRQGEVVGYVGDSGNAGRGNYHLHFEVSTTADPSRYWGGVPQNPYPLLR